jgi:hypothetical protein
MIAAARNTLTAALLICNLLERAQPANAEFWRRLAGTIRKGITKI